MPGTTIKHSIGAQGFKNKTREVRESFSTVNKILWQAGYVAFLYVTLKHNLCLNFFNLVFYCETVLETSTVQRQNARREHQSDMLTC